MGEVGDLLKVVVWMKEGVIFSVVVGFYFVFVLLFGGFVFKYITFRYRLNYLYLISYFVFNRNGDLRLEKMGVLSWVTVFCWVGVFFNIVSCFFVGCFGDLLYFWDDVF